jgi:azurin/lysophospholipase L1-like esterase
VRFHAPFVFGLAAMVAPAQARLELRPGDRIALVGNALADRLQHSGWLETLVHARFPSHRLKFRNLAVAGDEVTTWHRSQGFGTRDEWLAKVKVDVVLAFYGFNESFRGAAGLPRFQDDLERFVRHTLAQDYGGRGKARLVLFSPIRSERHRDPAFPDPAATNKNLEVYAGAIAEVARAHGVPFVDLMAPSQKLFEEAAKAGTSLTINGLHLSEEGDRLLAPAMFRQLFGEEPPGGDFAKLRAAVHEKNRCWHQRYRTIDGYNVYGGRSLEKYAPKDKEGRTGEPILNRTVMQREMAMRDVMTENRDARVWAVAGGGDLEVKDDNLPEPVPVATNRPGDREDMSFSYPDGEAVIGKLQVAPGCRVNLWADEKRFKELVNPVQMAWDARGRLWVAVWPNYPERTPTSTRGDALLVLEDTDGDGRADRCAPFVEDLNAPTGFAFYRDGVLLMQAPDLWFVRDTDGDGRADHKERVVMGIDSADSHHTANALGPDPAGAVYLSDGVFHRTQIETARGPLRHADGCVWRYEPRTGAVDLYAPYELVNAHGKVWDEWGNDLLTNATDNHTFFGPAISGRLDSGKHPPLKEFWNRPSRPCPGTAIVSSAHFPPDWQGDFLNLNVIGLQGITRVEVSQDGSGLKGETVEHVVRADPKELPTFRPVCASCGPDGALYFCDWAQALIGHLQHHLRDPNRDHAHGRVYRVTYEGRPLATPPKIAGQPVAALLELLKSEVSGTRELAKLELGRHEPRDVVAALRPWLAGLDPEAPRHEHHLTEALWLCQSLDVLDHELLQRVLRSPKAEARAAATRVLCTWRERVPDALGSLRALAEDPDARVRLQAVRAASFFSGPDTEKAAGVAFRSLSHPGDDYLDYVFGETMRQLRAISGRVLLPDDAALAQRYAERLPDAELVRAGDAEPVLCERLARRGGDLPQRQAVLSRLAALRATTATQELVDALQRLETKGRSGASDDLARLFASQPAEDLGKARPAIVALARHARRPAIRRAAIAGLVAADGAESVLAAATEPKARLELIEAIPLFGSGSTRQQFEPTLRAILADAQTPAPLRAAALRALPLTGSEHAAQHFLLLAEALRAGQARGDAARSLLLLPRSAWHGAAASAAAGAAADSVLAWAHSVPARERTRREFLEITQCGAELAGLLPAAEATRLRQGLRALAVPVYVLHTVPEQMRYDRTRLVVEVGRPFEIVLVNDDSMPHNLAVVKPGMRVQVGIAAATLQPDQLDSEGRAYVPATGDLLAATKLVESGQSQKLAVAAIEKEGEYEYVCTMPGHFALMWGKLIVTKDVEAWLAAHPGEGAAPGPAGQGHGHGR